MGLDRCARWRRAELAPAVPQAMRANDVCRASFRVPTPSAPRGVAKEQSEQAAEAVRASAIGQAADGPADEPTLETRAAAALAAFFLLCFEN